MTTAVVVRTRCHPVSAAIRPRLNSGSALPAKCCRLPCRNGANTMSIRLPASLGRIPPDWLRLRPDAALISSTTHSTARNPTIRVAARPSGLPSDPSSTVAGELDELDGTGRLMLPSLAGIDRPVRPLPLGEQLLEPR